MKRAGQKSADELRPELSDDELLRAADAVFQALDRAERGAKEKDEENGQQ